MNDPVSAYYRLKRGKNEFFNFTLNNLIARMQSEAEAGDFSAALAYLHQLETASQTVDRLYQAQVRLECALAACYMHDPTLAARHLESALALLGPRASRNPFSAHTHGVVNWLLGLLVRPLSGPALAAATAWQHSLDAFEYLATEPNLTASEQGWYLDRRAEMMQSIDDALAGRQVRFHLNEARLQMDKPISINVNEQLSIARIGEPGPATVPVEQIRLQFSEYEFYINRMPHRLYSLRGSGGLLVLDSSRQYCALRVSGSWMDLIGIEYGDYVLLHLDAYGESGDIVAVEVFNGNSSAMIYHLMRNKDAIVLRPQSTSASHLTLEFGQDERDQYKIYGTVLGLFKPSMPGPTTPPVEQATPQPEAAPEPEAEGAPIPVEDYLLAFPLYSKIPAGSPKAVPIYTGRRLELDRFIIDDWPYYIVNLHKNDREINPGLGTVIFLKVIGDSMNDPDKANIQDGDYVLLLRQDSAEGGDIVAAEIRGVDDLATLKRFEVRGSNRVALVPESTNPEHQEREFFMPRLGRPASRQPFHIQGVALAVLKPYPKPNQ